MLSIIIALVCWALVIAGVVYVIILYDIYEFERIFVLCSLVFLVVGLVGTIAVNAIHTIRDTGPVPKYVKSVQELEIQTLKHQGQEIGVFVVSNTVTGLHVKRVKDVLPYNLTDNTRLWLVTDRTRMFLLWPIFGQSRVIDYEPDCGAK